MNAGQKSKSVTLHPLKPSEALRGLLQVKPEKKAAKPKKRRKSRPK